jgi:hypothetical protein
MPYSCASIFILFSVALSWLRRSVAAVTSWTPGFVPRSVLTRFVVDRMALGQDFFQSSSVFPCQCLCVIVSYLFVYQRRCIIVAITHAFDWSRFDISRKGEARLVRLQSWLSWGSQSLTIPIDKSEEKLRYLDCNLVSFLDSTPRRFFRYFSSNVFYWLGQHTGSSHCHLANTEMAEIVIAYRLSVWCTVNSALVVRPFVLRLFFALASLANLHHFLICAHSFSV